jgi:E3 ubiquitin-protein ligase RNF14
MAAAIDSNQVEALPDWKAYAANFDDQNDEIAALKSFYENTNNLDIVEEASLDLLTKFSLEFTIPIETNSRTKKIDIELWLPIDERTNQPISDGNETNSKKPKFERSMSGKRAHTKLTVEFLVPVKLNVHLPDNYPSEAEPNYTISSLWLNKLQLNQVCAKLDSLWNENATMPILFTWFEWIKTELVEFLDLIEEDSKLVCTPLSEDLFEFESEKSATRAVCLFQDSENFIYEFLRYNYIEEMRAFKNSTQTCLICFDEKLGGEFYRLSDCKHHFCAVCLGSMCQMHVKEGTIQLLK